MQCSPAMQALIEQIYHIFRRYPVPSRFHVCCPYCFSEEQQQALRGVSLRAIPFPLLHAWGTSIGPTPQNDDEIRYLLPRLFEFIAQRQFPGIYEGCCLQRIAEADNQNWRTDELQIISDFAYLYMQDWVSAKEVVELEIILEMFYRGGIKIEPLLDAIMSISGYWPTASMACLLWRNSKEYVENSDFEQSDDNKTITTQINTWARNNHPFLKERARQAIENPLKQPEPMTEYQVWEDDWMIDEYLCAMYDASPEQSGQ